MTWVYVLENQGKEDMRNNQPVFLLVKKLDIPDEFIVFDTNTDKVELNKLLNDIVRADRLIIRSVEDISNSMSELVEVFETLSDKGVILCSCEEPFFCGEDYLEYLQGYIKLHIYFNKKKKEIGYQKAVEEGRVGRPAKSKEIEQAISMYQSGNFKMAQIEALTGISKSTIYRYLNKQN